MAGDTPGASTTYVIIQGSRVTGEIQIWHQENGDQEKERVDNPEFVALVAHTDPSAQDEVLKMASVMESLG